MSAAQVTPHVVCCDDVAPQAWRNGGGRTRELLAWPQTAEWHCRVSVADIEGDGPFSAIPGVDRWFAVVEGAGVLLQLPDGEHRLDRHSAALHFTGEVAPHCQLLSGPTRDLNLMGARGRGRASMQRALPEVPWIDRANLRALFSADPVTLRRGGADALVVAPFTLVWAEDSAAGSWSIAAMGDDPRAWWMSFTIGSDA
jgi:environmental stress-induced protein Ves